MAIPKVLKTEKFAEHKELIMVLYLADDEFKAICDDYCTCKLNLEKYRKKSQEDSQCESDYETLSIDLEEEILRFITRNK